MAGNHAGAHTSMPHPLFGAKEVCCIEKKRPHFILAGTLQGTLSPTPPALNGHAKKSVVAAGLRSLCILVFNHLVADMADSLASVPAALATPTAGAGA